MKFAFAKEELFVSNHFCNSEKTVQQQIIIERKLPLRQPGF